MNWRFWKRESIAQVMRREIEALRRSNTNAQARIMALEKENAEAWEVLAALAVRVETPDDTSGFFGWMICASRHEEKLKQASTRMRQEVKRG